MSRDKLFILKKYLENNFCKKFIYKKDFFITFSIYL